jgi:hypothetical protein
VFTSALHCSLHWIGNYELHACSLRALLLWLQGQHKHAESSFSLSVNNKMSPSLVPNLSLITFQIVNSELKSTGSSVTVYNSRGNVSNIPGTTTHKYSQFFQERVCKEAVTARTEFIASLHVYTDDKWCVHHTSRHSTLHYDYIIILRRNKP